MSQTHTTSAPATTPNAATGAATGTPQKALDQAAATPAEIRNLKLRLDGKDVEMPESEVIALAQKGKVSDQRFQEASAMKRQAEEVLKFAKDNTTEFFKRTGMNARQWAEEYLVGELRAEQMSPEQRKAAENEKKLKEYESEKKQAADRAQQAEMDQLRQKHAENYNKLFVEALTKSGLPKTNYTVKRMAELQLVNIKQKLELSADQLAKVVREDYESEQKALFGAYDGDQLMEFLGPELVKKLSKAQIAKLKAKGVKTSVSGDQHKPKKSGEPEMTWREYQLKNRGRG